MSNLKGVSSVFATFPLHLKMQLVFLKILVSFTATMEYQQELTGCHLIPRLDKGERYGLQGYPESAQDQV